MNRILQVFRDGQTTQPTLIQALRPGTAGNLQTLRIMSEIVRHDRTQGDLRAYVLREIVGDANGFDEEAQIQRCFEFAQHEIVYQKDPVNVERIADLWSTLYALNPQQAEGDCGIKSTALATCLALIGYKPRFAVIRQSEFSNNFSHVFVEVFRSGSWMPLDPTPEEAPAGFEPESLQKATLEIFK